MYPTTRTRGGIVFRKIDEMLIIDSNFMININYAEVPRHYAKTKWFTSIAINWLRGAWYAYLIKEPIAHNTKYLQNCEKRKWSMSLLNSWCNNKNVKMLLFLVFWCIPYTGRYRNVRTALRNKYACKFSPIVFRCNRIRIVSQMMKLR